MKKIVFITCIALFINGNLTAQGVGNLGFLNWNDSFETTKQKLEATFGAIEKPDDTNTLISRGTFAGEKADLLLTYTTQNNATQLTAVQFTLNNQGEGSEAYIGYQNAYATLQELYGSPNSIDLFSGERKWTFDDGSFITLKTSRSDSEESRKTKGTLSGQGTLKGQTRTLGRDGGRTDADYTLDLNPAHNAEGLKWDGEQVVKILNIETLINFSKPIQTTPPTGVAVEDPNIKP